MGDEFVADWTALERHRLRRGQRVPTVTVLVGDPDAGEWLWSRWQRESGRSSVVLAASDWSAILLEWLADARFADQYIRRLWDAVADRGGVTVAELQTQMTARTDWQRAEMVASMAPKLGLPSDVVESALGGAGDVLPQRICDGFPATLIAVVRTLGVATPALFVRKPELGSADWPVAVIAGMARLAEAVSEVDVAVAVSAAELCSWQASAPERLFAALREGVVEVVPGGTEDGVDAERHGGQPVETALRYDAAEFARSQAERTLYRRLNERPSTEGLFELNVKLDERFGGMDIEVDLLSAQLRVAIEVDGYHHFRDSSAYRRDRRKDLLLQELGYLVIRVLATDVVEEPQYVLEQIDRALERRLTRSA
jgi:very-short-patch-repair endonuclease